MLTCMFTFGKVHLMYVIGYDTDDALGEDSVTADGVEEAQDRVVGVTLPQQQVVHGTAHHRQTRLQVEAWLDHV